MSDVSPNPLTWIIVSSNCSEIPITLNSNELDNDRHVFLKVTRQSLANHSNFVYILTQTINPDNHPPCSALMMTNSKGEDFQLAIKSRKIRVRISVKLI